MRSRPSVLVSMRSKQSSECAQCAISLKAVQVCLELVGFTLNCIISFNLIFFFTNITEKLKVELVQYNGRAVCISFATSYFCQTCLLRRSLIRAPTDLRGTHGEVTEQHDASVGRPRDPASRIGSRPWPGEPGRGRRAGDGVVQRVLRDAVADQQELRCWKKSTCDTTVLQDGLCQFD